MKYGTQFSMGNKDEWKDCRKYIKQTPNETDCHGKERQTEVMPEVINIEWDIMSDGK